MHPSFQWAWHVSHMARPSVRSTGGLPHVEGWVKASRRLIRKGCLRRLRMQTSRSTRLACSGLLSTSGMRFRATCSTDAVAELTQMLSLRRQRS